MFEFHTDQGLEPRVQIFKMPHSNSALHGSTISICTPLSFYCLNNYRIKYVVNQSLFETQAKVHFHYALLAQHVVNERKYL